MSSKSGNSGATNADSNRGGSVPKKSIALVLVVASGMLAVGLLARLNPEKVNKAWAPSAAEILEDPSFEVGQEFSAWRPVEGSPPKTYARALTRSALSGSAVGSLKGTVRQDVPITPLNMVPYRFSLAAKSADASPAPVQLRLQTACASDEERASTTTKVGPKWTLVTVTLIPVHGDECSMRVEIASEGAVLLDAASLGGTGVGNSSFERGTENWTFIPGGSTEKFSTRVEEGAPDGGAVAVLPSGTEVKQLVTLDRSSQPLIVRSAVRARSVDGKPVRVQLRLWPACVAEPIVVEATLGAEWNTVTAAQPRLETPKGELPVDPPGIIRVDGEPCTTGISLRTIEGGPVEVDDFVLHVGSYNPPLGSPRYRASLKGLQFDIPVPEAEPIEDLTRG